MHVSKTDPLVSNDGIVVSVGWLEESHRLVKGFFAYLAGVGLPECIWVHGYSSIYIQKLRKHKNCILLFTL